jgi:nucleoside-diphosphate-sugar epimerase
MTGEPSPCLILGASGIVGRAVLQCAPGQRRLLAVSRQPPTAQGGVPWLSADLFRDPLVFDGAEVLCAGPLDGLVAWLARERPAGIRRVVALSSTSVHVKRDSVDPDERALAQRLAASETALAHWCTANGAHWTLLRPTLIYDDHFDGALSRVLALATRLRVIGLPYASDGLRQPVHAADVAAAMWAALARHDTFDRAYDLPGGETLSYREMVRRTLAVAAPGTRLVTLPAFVLRAIAVGGGRLPALRGFQRAVLARMATDLVFDAQAARRDLEFSPRGFPQPNHSPSPGDR